MLLLIGDFHIPDRASHIPRAIKERVESREYELVLCTGDLTGEDVLEWLQSLGGSVKVVEGNMDYLSLPTYETVEYGDLIIGLVHGHQVYPRGDVVKLGALADSMGVQILVTGHTHFPQLETIKTARPHIILNPGSATGCWGGDPRATGIPSFMEMEVRGRAIDVSLFEVSEGALTERKFRLKLHGEV